MAAESCPICQRPFAVQTGPNNATDGCYRQLPGRTFRDERLIVCLKLGVQFRDRLIAENVAALKQRDELLARARDLLVGVHAGLTEALERLPEVEGG